MASSHQPKDFDVFLSFRGEDTRRSFVSHLFEALGRQGIQTFIDDNLHRGENISKELLKVIENSSISIIVFSKNYASSSWCLDELAKIIECTKKVFPVFYEVEPSEVRKQKGDFGKALTRLEKKIKDKTKVQRWREALTNAANISGWDYRDKDKDSCTESELVQKIVEEILNSEFIQMPSNDARMQLVGINSHMEAVTKLLDIESNDVRMVGITGLGGIGKTTIAKAIYNSFSKCFNATSFLENVREGSKTDQGIIHLQETLLKGISEDKNLRVNTIYEGTTRINKILRLKKVLIILDDVDNADQIETLLGQCECFAFGSRIILTTRNKSLLVDRNGLSTYEYGVKELDEDEAIKLFRKHAFPSNKVPEDYLELEKQAISYAKGLPLALKVIGRDLCEKTIHEWDDALDRYKTNPPEDVQNILKRSYDGLTGNEKKFQQVAQQRPGEPSRLWWNEESLDVLTENVGSDKIQSLKFWSPNRPLECLPNELRHLEVASYRSLDLQSFFQLLPEIIRLPPNLPPCLGVSSHMLMFPHSSTLFPIWQNCPCEYSFEVTGDENDIPNWFNHQRDGNLISFSIGPEFPTIALCIAFGIQDSHCNFFYHVIISINGSERMFGRNFIEKDMTFGHLSFSCRSQSSLQELFWDLQLTDQNHVEILCETFHNSQEIAPIIKMIGVHVECNCPPPQNPSIFQDINRHLSLQSGEVPSSPVIKKSKEISETEDRGECEDETDADIETTLKTKVITPEQDESNEEDPSPSTSSVEKCLLTLTQGARESSLSTSQDPVECSSPMSQTPNSRNEAYVLTNTWSNQDGVQDLSFESIKVSEISERMDLPTRVHSLKIEGCDDLEFIPKGVMSSELSLQDLYIINCCSLKSFPKDHPPTALKILYIRNCKKLNFPLTTEKKTHQDALLEYLCIGSSCDSLKSISLDLFPNLKSLSIWDCANLELLSMPVQKNLTSLEALEIRDCPNLVSFLGGGLRTMNLTSVWLSNCKKLEKLPELHTLDSLQSMFINNCPELVSLSEKGLPSRLSLLSITFCNKLKLKDEWGLDGLAYLHRLEIEGGCVDVGSLPEKFLPSNLRSLRISGLSNLKNLDNKGFQQLTALQRLEISCCPNLQSLPEDGFPSSLSFLCIKECPLLTSKFRNKKGKDWSKIDHISCIEIDEEVIS